MSETDGHFDVVIVGAGTSGSILAKDLTNRGISVLILEAGDGQAKSQDGYRELVRNYFLADIKIPNSPYPVVRSADGRSFADQPTVLDDKLISEEGGGEQYMLQAGKRPHRSSYTRTLGGTVLHWLGTCLRMVPENFEMRSKFDQGQNWPIGYSSLQKYYRMAEFEIGVSADVEEQGYQGIDFEQDYVFPMRAIPKSYLDKVLNQRMNGFVANHGGSNCSPTIVSTPQGRNSIPNPNYDRGGGYRPRGAIGNPEIGQRCVGNSSCVPICPVQAKYNPLKTLADAKEDNLVLSVRSVARQVIWDQGTGIIKGVEYINYKKDGSIDGKPKTARGQIFVLCAHAVENAKLLLNSGIKSTSRLVGKNLMDHPVMLTWGKMPEPVWSYRGPGSTSGIADFAAGKFRSEMAAFRIEIGNWGWNWAAGAPYSTVNSLVDDNIFGMDLRRSIKEDTSRHIRFGFLFEQLPNPANCVSVDPSIKDKSGIPRPIIQYDLDEYTLRGMKHAKSVSSQIFKHVGIEDCTSYNPADSGFINFEGEDLSYFGAGHFGGTHVMGSSPKSSVVDSHQRCWDHQNLFLVGCGSFPTMGTENPTLTMAALAFRTAEEIAREFTSAIA